MTQVANQETNPLWHLNFKINAIGRGFNTKFHIADKAEADALTAANDIATRLKILLPTDAEIFYATISRDNTKKDSRFLASALGQGTFLLDPEDEGSSYDNAGTAILVRFEHTSGGSVTRKFCPIPDGVVTGGQPTSPITAITTAPVAAPAASSGADTWFVNFNKFMGAVCFYTHHLVSGHQPGGGYEYFGLNRAYVLRTGKKKGGPVLAE